MKRAVDGREVLVLTPLQLLKKLAAVCPPPGKHLVHFHGVLAPNAKHRRAVVGFGRTLPAPPPAPVEPQAWLPLEGLAPPPPRPRRPRLDWASLMRKTFGLDLLTCARCGGRRKVLAAVTDRDALDAEFVARGLPTLRATRAGAASGPGSEMASLGIAGASSELNTAAGRPLPPRSSCRLALAEPSCSRRYPRAPCGSGCRRNFSAACSRL